MSSLNTYLNKATQIQETDENSSFVFKLFVSCPKCKDEASYWAHAACSTTMFINDEGFIFCENSKKGKKCQKFFIQEAKFNCNKDQHGVEYSSYEKLSDFMQAMATSVKSIENDTRDMSKLQSFLQRLTTNLPKHWKFT